MMAHQNTWPSDSPKWLSQRDMETGRTSVAIKQDIARDNQRVEIPTPVRTGLFHQPGAWPEATFWSGTGRQFLQRYGVKPFVLVALLLHGGLLMWPLQSPSPKSEAEPQAVKVVPLPRSSAQVTPQPAIKSLPKAKPLAQPAVSVPTTPTLRVRSPLVTRVPVKQTVPSPAFQPKVPGSKASPPTAPPVSPATTSDFPTYPHAKPGSLGLFQGTIDQVSQYTSDHLDQVAAYFQSQFTTRGFKLTPMHQATGKRLVWQVTTPTQVQVLNLFEHNGHTVMVVSDRPVEPGQDGVVVLDDLVRILNQYMPAEVEDFAQAEGFYQGQGTDLQEHPHSEGGFRIVPDRSPAEVVSTLQADLQSQNFTIAAAKPFRGGMMYEVQQGEFKRYLNLLPDQTGTGTLIVLWVKLPAS